MAGNTWRIGGLQGALWLSLGTMAATGCGGKCDKPDQIEAYADNDGDGYGGEQIKGVCVLEANMVSEPGDCNDNDPSVNPGAVEPECNGIDEDCDGLDNGPDALVFYEDLDGDDYGNIDVVLIACAPPDDSWARSDEDCDDTNSDVNPGAVEVCNDGIDDDCDSLADDEDDSLDPTSYIAYFQDNDGDGYGRPGPSVEQCAQPESAAPNEDDCDDTNPDVNPDAPEVCDRVDNDCDGLRDDEDDSLDTAGLQEMYADLDGDGFGDADSLVMSCFPRPGVASDNADDCDDTDGTNNPAAPERLCDGIDNDCDAATDDDLDRDEDGYMSCADNDCDDLDSEVHPDAVETPGDGLDANCDGYEDCYQDLDGDGSRGEVLVQVVNPFCSTGYNAPPGRPIDCDDNDEEITISGRWETDYDLDGYGDGVVSLTGVCVDPGPGYALEGGELDCDDIDPAISPGADDPCNDGLDANCDTFDDCVSCNDWLLSDPLLTSGVYTLRPSAEGTLDVYCDMETDGGGWTLVTSSLAPPNDARIAYHDELQTLEPTTPQPGVWDGLRDQVTDVTDVRFACKTLVIDADMTVDLSFYDVPWYLEITTGADADSCFNEQGYPDPTPARRDNIAGILLDETNPYDSGQLEGEDTCDDTNDFTVDFDDAGMDGDSADGTDWGEEDGKEKCGATESGESWFIFVR